MELALFMAHVELFQRDFVGVDVIMYDPFEFLSWN